MHANQRRKTNRISGILDQQGNLVTEANQIGAIFSNFFCKLFTSSSPQDINQCLHNLLQKIFKDENSKLVVEFMNQEINDALFKMNPLRAPGSDDFPAHFYQKYWGVLCYKVHQFVVKILNQQCSLDKVNETFIILIPKYKEAIKAGDFRPISLCNVVYKLVDKVLANRLKQILLKVISPTQSTFYPGRLISDNILIAYETLHS